MSGRNSLAAVLICRLTGQFEDFTNDVLQDCSHEDGASLSEALRVAALLEIPTNTTDGEDEANLGLATSCLGTSLLTGLVALSYLWSHIVHD